MLLVVSKRREGGRGKFWSSYPFLRPTNGARAGGGGVGGGVGSFFLEGCYDGEDQY